MQNNMPATFIQSLKSINYEESYIIGSCFTANTLR